MKTPLKTRIEDAPQINRITGGAHCARKASLGPIGHIAKATSCVRQPVMRNTCLGFMNKTMKRPRQKDRKRIIEMTNKKSIIRITFPLLIILFTGCATKLSYAPTSSYSEGDSRNINDEDILKAFQAEPQIKLPTKVAWYNMSRDSLIDLIQYKNEQTIVENYNIPKTLVEGFQPLFDNPNYGYFNSSNPVNFKTVRLLAARAKCDIVVLVSSRFEEKRDINGWATLNVLIIPALLTPYWNIKYKYAAEVFVFDVRNGYMYKHLKYENDERKKLISVWKAEKIAETINGKMIKNSADYMKEEIKKLFEEKKNKNKIEDAGAEE